MPTSASVLFDRSNAVEIGFVENKGLSFDGPVRKLLIFGSTALLLFDLNVFGNLYQNKIRGAVRSK
jgi:hypothetical protein